MAFTRVREFLRPESSREAVDLLATYGNRALLLAGGTFIHGLAARGLGSGVDALIDLQKAGLAYVKAENGAVAIGAMTTFTELAEAEPVKSRPELGAVWDALQCPPAQIRNMATVGGTVASASPLFDLPVAFLALDGAVKALGANDAREIGLSEFFVDYFEHTLAKDELLTEVLLPKLPARSASAFLKLETNANDLALLNVATRITVDAAGECQEARVILGGGVGKVPTRAVSSEKALKGQRPSRELVDKAAQAVSADLHPVSDHRASAQYRAAVAKVFVRRALIRTLERLGVELG
ncbi:MAG: FAD binding domain-containing protein [Terriglobia bacterium]